MLRNTALPTDAPYLVVTRDGNVVACAHTRADGEDFKRRYARSARQYGWTVQRSPSPAKYVPMAHANIAVWSLARGVAPERVEDYNRAHCGYPHGTLEAWYGRVTWTRLQARANVPAFPWDYMNRLAQIGNAYGVRGRAGAGRVRNRAAYAHGEGV